MRTCFNGVVGRFGRWAGGTSVRDLSRWDVMGKPCCAAFWSATGMFSSSHQEGIVCFKSQTDPWEKQTYKHMLGKQVMSLHCTLHCKLCNGGDKSGWCDISLSIQKIQVVILLSQDNRSSWWCTSSLVFAKEPQSRSSGQCCLGHLPLHWERKGMFNYAQFRNRFICISPWNEMTVFQ